MGLLFLSLVALAALPCPAQLPIEGKELFVAVGYGGRRISSTTGIYWGFEQRWSDEAKDDDNVLTDVVYGHGRFIAVGGGAKIGHMLMTKDGREWRALPQREERIGTIAFGNGRFVAAQGAVLLHSVDGEDFQSGATLDWEATVHPRQSAYGDGEGGAMFVVIGEAGFPGEAQPVPYRVSSSDGTRYTSAKRDTAPARGIAYGSGHFVVVGPRGLIESSHDGQNWTSRETDPDEDFTSVVWTGSRFLAGGKQVWTSPDGLHWSRALKEVWNSPDGVKWSKTSGGFPGQIVWALDNFGGLCMPWGGQLYYGSSDFRMWTRAALPDGPSFTAVARRTE